MTTLLHMTQTILDVQETLMREQRFSQDACQNLLTGVKLLREATDALERDIRSHFEDRDRSVSRVIGNSQPYTTVIDNAPGAEQIEDHTPAPKASKAAKSAE
jgi:hypothetical protein